MTTLGSFLRALRFSLKPWPDLSEQDLQAMSLPVILQEMKRRRYPAGRQALTTPERAIRQFLHCQGKARTPSQRDIALRAGLHVTLISKAENDKQDKVNAASLRRILINGLGIPESDERYITAFGLWQKAREGTFTLPDYASAVSAAGVVIESPLHQVLRDLAPVLAQIPTEEYRNIREFLAQPQLRALIPGLLRAAAPATPAKAQ